MTGIDIASELDFLTTLHGLIEAYEEIAATRMRKIRSSVVQTRDFTAGITDIFQEVKSSYRNELLLLMEKKKIKDPSKLSLVKRNGKTVAVLLSSNTGLYGDIVQKTFRSFLEYLVSNTADAAVVGRLGRSLFVSAFEGRPFSYFDFPDSSVDQQAISKIIDFVIQYEKILVFYGQFQNIVTQNPMVLDVYGSQPELHGQTSQLAGQVVSRYFFEPSLEEIMLFFEAEIFASIFEQTVHESNLAKFAARMLNLDLATENIRNRLMQVELNGRRFKHRLLNTKQLASLSGMSLWRAQT